MNRAPAAASDGAASPALRRRRVLHFVLLSSVAIWVCAVSLTSAQEMGGRSSGQAAATAALSRSVHRNLGCRSCHSEMSFVIGGTPDPVATCARCHSPQSPRGSADGHAIALRAGNTKAPTCVTCHGSHDVLSRRDPMSRTHPANVPAQCGTCHTPSLTTFREGVHGSELQLNKGLNTATCTSCHTARVDDSG
jgi:hypothetical protein